MQRSSRHPKFSHPEHQRGAVLMFSLVILLVMTLVGVMAMSSSTLEERMASNHWLTNKAFQAAESAIDVVFVTSATNPADLSAALASGVTTIADTLTGDSDVSSTATIQYVVQGTPPLGYDLEKFVGLHFRIEGEGKVGTAGSEAAETTNVQSINRAMASPENS